MLMLSQSLWPFFSSGFLPLTGFDHLQFSGASRRYHVSGEEHLLIGLLLDLLLGEEGQIASSSQRIVSADHHSC
jgi:hypothetical protein